MESSTTRLQIIAVSVEVAPMSCSEVWNTPRYQDGTTKMPFCQIYSASNIPLQRDKNSRTPTFFSLDLNKLRRLRIRHAHPPLASPASPGTHERDGVKNTLFKPHASHVRKCHPRIAVDPARICTDSYLTQMRGEENQEMMVWMSYVQKSGVGGGGGGCLCIGRGFDRSRAWGRFCSGRRGNT